MTGKLIRLEYEIDDGTDAPFVDAIVMPESWSGWSIPGEVEKEQQRRLVNREAARAEGELEAARTAADEAEKRLVEATAALDTAGAEADAQRARVDELEKTDPAEFKRAADRAKAEAAVIEQFQALRGA